MEHGYDNPQWEINYKAGKEINRFPSENLVSTWFKYKNLIESTDENIYKICELGCGCGNNLWIFAEDGHEVYGVDISPTAISHAEKLFKKKNITGNFKVCSIFNNNYPDNSFDFVIDRACFFHNPDKFDIAVKEAYRILKPGGIFYSWFYDTEHNITKEQAYNMWYKLPLCLVDYSTNFKIFDLIKHDKIKIESNIDNKIYKYSLASVLCKKRVIK